MACNCGCYCCANLVKSTAVALDTENNVLNITIPEATYTNHQRVCLVITQAIPSGINANTTVNILVGAGTTGYTLYTRFLNDVYADSLSARRVYPLLVATDTSSFVIEDVKRLKTTLHTFSTLPA